MGHLSPRSHVTTCEMFGARRRRTFQNRRHPPFRHWPYQTIDSMNIPAFKEIGTGGDAHQARTNIRPKNGCEPTNPTQLAPTQFGASDRERDNATPITSGRWEWVPSSSRTPPGSKSPKNRPRGSIPCPQAQMTSLGPSASPIGIPKNRTQG